MKKIMIMLGILIGLASCTDANGSIHKTPNGSVYRTVCASRYDCTEVRVENSDFSKWLNGEMSDEEYDALPDSTWVSMYFIPKDKDALMDTEFEDEETVKESYDESSLYPDYEAIQEVKRRWKVNNKGKRRIKMKCKPGFKWTGKSCEKISGVELAKKRKAIIKMGRTKRAQGDRLKRRVKRLTAKARRFRKSFGLKN